MAKDSYTLTVTTKYYFNKIKITVTQKNTTAEYFDSSKRQKCHQLFFCKKSK